MVLGFGFHGTGEHQNLIVCGARQSDGTYNRYDVYLDDTRIGETYGAKNHLIVIDLIGYGDYLFDADKLMDRMIKHMDLNDLLSMGKPIEFDELISVFNDW